MGHHFREARNFSVFVQKSIFSIIIWPFCFFALLLCLGVWTEIIRNPGKDPLAATVLGFAFPPVIVAFAIWLALWSNFGEERYTASQKEIVVESYVLGKRVRTDISIPKSEIIKVEVKRVRWTSKGHEFTRLAICFSLKNGKSWETGVGLSPESAQGLLEFLQRETAVV